MNIHLRIKRKIYKFFHPVWGEILMLHRIVRNHSELEENRKLEITPEFLEQTILDYQAKGYQFFSLDEVHEFVAKQIKPKSKFVCFTFDDGYIDNFELAYPIFKKYNCPFAIFITTNFPDQKALLWWYVLEDIIIGNDYLLLGDGSSYDCSTIEKKNTTFALVRTKIFSLQSQNMELVLNRLLLNYKFSFLDKNQALAMNWKQINELANSKLCTIASHTVTHGMLPNMHTEQIKAELKESKSLLENYTKNKIDHFAYPYGASNEEIMKQVASAGYKTAILANGGKVRKGQKVWSITRLDLIEK